MNAPFKTETLPQWRLDDLYSSREDPRIEADLKEAERVNKELAKLEGRLVATRAKPAELGGIIDRGIQLYEDAGVDQVLLIMQTETVPHEKVLSSLEMYGKYVIPAFKSRSSARPVAAGA